jgi:hypothetical protein
MAPNTLTFPKSQPLILLGDNHGDWRNLLSLIDYKEITNATLIHLGDDGIGFQEDNHKEHELCNKLNEEFKKRNIHFYSLRGNHCNPKYFEGENRIALSHFQLIEDYTIGQWGEKKIQFVGGALSIDRLGRIPLRSYWPDEKVKYEPKKCQKVDILITHTCPSWCHPQRFGDLVEDWARIDKALKKDLQNERAILDQIFALCQPKYHYYGHMHHSWSEKINGCHHRLLDINELYEHPNLPLQPQHPKPNKKDNEIHSEKIP